MARYDWPHDTQLFDDGFGRRRYNDHLFPAPDFRLPDGSFPPVGDPPSDPPPVAEDLWLPLGPSVVLGGQASGGPRVAGRVRDLAVEPSQGDRLYAATGSGGVWFSDSRGVSWEPLDNFRSSLNRNTQTPVGNSLSTGAIHVAWGAADDGSQDVVTVGTGEIHGTGGVGAPGPNLAGVGVLRSTGPATGALWDREAVSGASDLRGYGFYRIVHDPGDPSVLLAATTRGLMVRSAPGTWALSSASGIANRRRCVDVAVTRHPSSNGVRVWVAQDSELWVAESTTLATSPVISPATLTFSQVTLPNVRVQTNSAGKLVEWTRLALAVGADSADLWVLGRRKAPVGESFAPAHLWHVDTGRPLTGGPIVASEVPGTPPALFGVEKDQSSYDMAIVAHPVDDRLWVGGSAESIDHEWNAALYHVAVSRIGGGFTATSTSVGRGIHSDVHSIRHAPSPSPGDEVAIWIGCDGGVFLSDRDGDLNSYVARNTGMATLEPGFVASHPTNDGIVAAGMQDNGVCVRAGDTVWLQPFKGDGGGLVYDPAHANRFINQYLRATWRFFGSQSKKPVHRRWLVSKGTTKNSQDLEADKSAFYSGADAIVHAGTTHLALGTYRVWYSDDWGRSWVTLPTGTDPRSELAADLQQDALIAGQASEKFTDTEPARSFLCCDDTEKGTATLGAAILTVKWAARSAASGRDRVRLAALVNNNDNSSGLALIEGDRAVGSTGSWSWTVPVKDRPIRNPDPGTPDEATKVAAGAPTTFLPAPALVNDVAPHLPEKGDDGSYYITTVGRGLGATAIDTLWWYDGDGMFMPTGLRREHARGIWADPRQRITAPAHAVIVDPLDQNTVYVGTSVGVVKGTFDPGGPSWTWERFDNNLPEAVVHDLSIHHHDGLHLLRAALGARGIWEVDLAASKAQPPRNKVSPRSYLRLFPTDTRRRLPTPLTGPATRGSGDDMRWDNSPDLRIDQTAFVYPGGPLEPTLNELRQPRFGNGVTAEIDDPTMRVHVLVHHRWHAPAPPSELRVALVRHDMAADGTVALGALWPALVAISDGGGVPAALPDGWSAAIPTLLAPVAAPVTARTPRAATFDVDLTPAAGRNVLLLAVVISDDDPLTAAEIRHDGSDATTVEQLVVRSRHAAARSIRAG